MVVESEACEAVEIAAQRDADHVRRDLLDARDFEIAPPGLVPDAAGRARIRFDVRGIKGDRRHARAPEIQTGV
jgi:hypothetical protein